MKGKKKIVVLLAALVLVAAGVLAAVLLAGGQNKNKQVHQAIVVENDGYLAVDVKSTAGGAYTGTGLHYAVLAETGTVIKDESGQDIGYDDLVPGMRVEIVEYNEGMRNSMYPPTLVASSIKVTGTAGQSEYAEALESLDMLRGVQAQIYYVEDGELQAVPEMTISKRDVIFSLWLGQNKLPESAQLAAFAQEDNSYEESEENGQGGVVSYVFGDTAYLTIELDDPDGALAAAENTKLLLEGLCRTFLSYGAPYASCEATVMVNGQIEYEGDIDQVGMFLR